MFGIGVIARGINKSSNGSGMLGMDVGIAMANNLATTPVSLGVVLTEIVPVARFEAEGGTRRVVDVEYVVG